MFYAKNAFVRSAARARIWCRLVHPKSAVPRWFGLSCGFATAVAASSVVLAAPIPIGGAGGNLPNGRAGGSTSTAPAGIDDGLCTLICERPTPEKLRELLSGARAQYVNVVGIAGVTPLMIAAFLGDVSVVQVLLDFGADTEVDSTPPRSTALWRAYFDPYQNLGPNLRAIDFAILGGHPDVIVKLIDSAKSDPTIPRIVKTPGQQTPGGQVVAAAETKTVTLEQRVDQSWRVLTATNFDAKEQAKSLLKGAIAAGKARRNERLQDYRRQFPLEARLAEQLVGQQPAIQTVSSAVRRKENGWVDADSPLVMLFMGSSGIGKTRTAKLIGEYLHGADDKEKLNKCFVRVDMSEFQHKHEVSKFIGSPPGYVGYEAGGQLVSKLESCPNAVVLLDEVEKAHPDVLTVMLQAFDEGRMTDGKGKTINCSDAVFILTSNLAQREIADEAVRLRQLGSATDAHHHMQNSDVAVEAGVDPLTKAFKRDVVQPILRKHFGRDEFIGRINETVFFLPFTEDEQRLLASMELEAWAKRAQEKQGIELTWSPEVAAVAAEEYDLRYGARSIKYEIDRMCIAPIARAQEQGVVSPGCRVHIDVDRRILAQLQHKTKEAEQMRKAHAEKERLRLESLMAPRLHPDLTGANSKSNTAPQAPKTIEVQTAGDAEAASAPPVELKNLPPPPVALPGATLYRSGKVALSVFPGNNTPQSGTVGGGIRKLLGLGR